MIAPSVLKDRYELRDQLGEGGMGVVYKAWDRELKAERAVKVISGAADAPDRKLLREAFLEEARKTFELSHPNIVRTYDAGADGEVVFLTMELLQGESLETVLNRYPEGVPWEECHELISQLLDGVEYLHSQKRKIIHSDLKPGNVFVTEQQVVKVLDFGIASRQRGIGGAPTRFDPRVYRPGSAAYASIEQLGGIAADPRDDVYSLGCLIYQLLSGRHPFGINRSDADRSAIWARANKLVVAPIDALTRGQNSALRRAVAFERKDRTQTVRQLRDELFVPDSGNARSIAIGVVAAGVLVAAGAGIWLRHPRTAPVAVAPVTEPAVAAPTPAAAPVDPFRRQCDLPAEAASVDALLKRGLEAQVMLSFSANAEANAKAKAEMLKMLECLRLLQDRGLATAESREWLKDTTRTLAEQ